MIATLEPFIRSMMAARHGTLVGISSVAGGRGLPGSSGAYSASKSAATKYLEALRVEIRPRRHRGGHHRASYVRSEMTARNPYPMPFLMDTDRFASQTADAIAHDLSVADAHRGMLLHVLPRWLYDFAFERAPRKPRADE